MPPKKAAISLFDAPLMLYVRLLRRLELAVLLLKVRFVVGCFWISRLLFLCACAVLYGVRYFLNAECDLHDSAYLFDCFGLAHAEMRVPCLDFFFFFFSIRRDLIRVCSVFFLSLTS